MSTEPQATPTTGTTTEAPTNRWLALAVICMAMFMGVLDSTSVVSALPTIANDLDFPPAQTQWVITAYGVAVGGLLLLGGRLADYGGRRRVFMIAVALFAVASLMCGMAWSSDVLIAARVIQGIGAAILTPAGLSILMTIFPSGPERNKALGIWGGLGGIGATGGLLLGGVLTDWVGWEWIFYTNIPVCLAVLALGAVLLPDVKPRDQKMDLPGAVTGTVALVLLLFALFSIADGNSPSVTGLLLAGSVALAALFVLVESRSRAPLVPFRIFRSRNLVGGNVVIIVGGISVDGLLITLTLYAQQVLGYSALQYGLIMAIMTVASVGGVMAGQHLVTRFGFRLVATSGLGMLALASVMLSRLSVDSTLVQDLLGGLLVFGVGMGAAFVSGQIAALAEVPSHDSGLAAGIEETSFSIGSTMGAAIAVTVAVTYASNVGGQPDAALASGVGVALLVLGATAAVGAIAAMVLLRTHRD